MLLMIYIVFDIHRFFSVQDWRRQMKYPPKLSELWKSAKELNLYGYEDDEDEETFLAHRCALYSCNNDT